MNMSFVMKNDCFLWFYKARIYATVTKIINSNEVPEKKVIAISIKQ